MKTIFKITALITAAAFVLGACAAGQPAPTETQPQTPEATITSSPGGTFTPPPSATTRPTSTRKPSPTPRLTIRPTSTQRPSPTPRPTHAGPTPTAISPEENSFVTEGTPVPQPDSVISVENAGQLVELARWGYGEIDRVIHTVDGQLMLVQTDAGVYAFRVGTLDEVWRFQPDEVVTGIELLEDGDIQVGALRRTLYRLDASDGSLLETTTGNLPEADEYLPGEPLSREESSVDPAVIDAFLEQVEVNTGLRFRGTSPNGNYFVFAGASSTVAVYRVSDFSLVLLFDPENSLGMISAHLAKPVPTSGLDEGFINSLVFNRSEKYLIAANFAGQIFFFDLELGVLNIYVHGNGLTLMIPPYGDSVIFYDEDSIEVYGIPSSERIASLNFELGVAWQMIYSPGGTRLAAGTTLWDTAEGAFTTMPENERVIGFSENGSYVYSIRQGSWWVERRTDNLVLHRQTSLEIQDTDFHTVWQLKTFFLSAAFWSYDSENNELTAYAAGVYVPTWDTQTGRLVEFPEDDLMPDDILWAYALSPDGAVRAEFPGNVLMLSDNLSGEILARFNLSPWELARVAFSPDGRYLAVGSRNGVVKIFGIPPTIEAAIDSSTVYQNTFVEEGTAIHQPVSAVTADNAGQLVELARWGYGAIHQVTHTKDGRLMLVQTDAGVYAYRVGTLDEVWRFLPGEAVIGMELGHGSEIKVGVEDSTIYRLDSSDGSLLETATGNLPEADEYLPGEPLSIENSGIDPAVMEAFFEQVEAPEAVTFHGISPKGEYAVFAGDENTVAVYRLSDFALVMLYDPNGVFGSTAPHDGAPLSISGIGPDTIITMVFTQDESKLIAYNNQMVLFSFDLEEGKLQTVIQGNGGYLIIPPEEEAVIDFNPVSIQIYSTLTGEQLAAKCFDGHLQQLVFSPSGRYLAFGEVVWDLESGTYQEMPEHESAIGFSQNGGSIFTIREEWVHLREPEESGSPYSLYGEWRLVTRSTPGMELADQVKLRIDNVSAYDEYELEMRISVNPVWFYFQETNQVMAHTSINFRATWDTQTGELLHYEENTPPLEISSARSPDGSIQADIVDEEVILTNTADGEILAVLDLSSWTPSRVAFSPDGRYLAVGSHNGVVRIFGVP